MTMHPLREFRRPYKTVWRWLKKPEECGWCRAPATLAAVCQWAEVT